MAIVRPNLAFLVTLSEYFLTSLLTSTIIFVMINVGHYGVFPRGERPIGVHMVSFDELRNSRKNSIYLDLIHVHYFFVILFTFFKRVKVKIAYMLSVIY